MIEFDFDATGSPLGQAWREGIAVGRAYELLRADVQSHLAKVQREIGFRYCRFHGLFHDDMQPVVRDANGELRFQWGQIEKVFDFLLTIGLKPFVELGPMPAALASGGQTFFYWRMNVTPPSAPSEWRLLVEQFAIWCIRTYGSREVRSWWFEVWNEPNLTAFWTGTFDNYAELYLVAAEALKKVDPLLRVGGPASAEGGWVEEFLEGPGRIAPPDFVSSHVYPMNEFGRYADRDESPHLPGRFMVDRVRQLRDSTRRLSPQASFFLTEWNALDSPDRESVDWMDNPTIDGIASAAVTARVCCELADDLDGMFWWVASDLFEEGGMPQSPFSGTYGLLTVDGIPKPSFHIFRYLSFLTGDVIGCDFAADGRGSIATRDGDVVHALLWNHVPAGLPDRRWEVAVDIVHQPGPATVVVRVIRPGKGSAFEVWREMGQPQNPTKAQRDALRASSEPEATLVQNGPVRLDLGANEVAFIEWPPGPDPLIDKTLLSERSIAWNTALAEEPV